MALKAVFFDVGETLVDEERWWRVLAERTGIEPQSLWAALGTTIERGEEHWAVWQRLGMERPDAWGEIVYDLADLYPDALACLESVSALGLSVGIAGNQSARLEEWIRGAGIPAEVVASSESLGVRKPDLAFFAALVGLTGCSAGEVAYVGDRVDNDVLPANRAGMVAIHLRRGPWGRLQPTPAGVPSIASLAELPAALESIV